MSWLDEIAQKIGSKKPAGQTQQNNGQGNNGQGNSQQQKPPPPQGSQESHMNNAGGNGGQGGEQSTKDKFDKLWQTDPNAEAAAAAKGNGKIFNTDMDSFNKAVGGMDFTKGASAELMQKALGGDTVSMQQLLNGVGRGAFSQAALASSQMVEEAFVRKTKDFEKTINDRFTEFSTKAQLRKANPAFSNPKIKPFVDMLEKQLRERFPEATPEEVTQYAQEYFTDMANDITAPEKQKAQNQQQQKVRADFGQFANEGDGSFDWVKYAEAPISAPNEPEQNTGAPVFGGRNI